MKSVLLNRCKEILNITELGSCVKKDDFLFLCELFKNHHDWKNKSGSGVKHITIGLAAYGTRCFIIIRNDNTTTDISYRCAISPKSKLSELKSACRCTIAPTILKFRDKNVIFGVTKCKLTGVILTKENTNIDHYNLTFAELFKEWVKSVDIDKIEISSIIDNTSCTNFVDKNIEADFIIFHNANTNLRAITKEANQKLRSK
jgi:hypothetical protein